MKILDRYIFRACCVSFLFYTVIFALVIWINLSISLVDELALDGHATSTILPLLILTIPDVCVRVLPVSTFAAAIFVTARLINDSELTVISAMGFSAFRVARPFILFGIMTSMIMLANTTYFAPHAGKLLEDRKFEINQNLLTKFLQAGKFHHPLTGVTVFTEEISQNGVLQKLFVSDRRRQEFAQEYTSERAILHPSNGQLVLVMQNGLLQTFDKENRSLSTTEFEELNYAFKPTISAHNKSKTKVKYLPTSVLWNDPRKAVKISGKPIAVIIERRNSRLQNGLLCLIAALIGFSTLYSAGYSRDGNARYVVLAILYLIVIKLVESIVIGQTRNNENSWPLIYAPTFVGVLIFVVSLHFDTIRQKRKKARL